MNIGGAGKWLQCRTAEQVLQTNCCKDGSIGLKLPKAFCGAWKLINAGLTGGISGL
jgi:hypothetical protein